MFENSFTSYAWSVGLAMPLILVSIGGLVWAFMNWKKASQPAMFAAIACGVIVLFSCIFPAMLTWGPQMVIGRNAGLDGLQRWLWIHRAIVGSQSLCWGLCVGALVFAVFAGRAAEVRKNKDKKKRSRDDDDDEEEDDRPRSKSRKQDTDEGIKERSKSKRPSRDDDDDD